MIGESPTRAALERKLRARARTFESSRQLRDEAIREAAAAGLSYRLIGRLTGLSYGRIGQIVRE